MVSTNFRTDNGWALEYLSEFNGVLGEADVRAADDKVRDFEFLNLVTNDGSAEQVLPRSVLR